MTTAYLLIALGLLLANGFFVGAEFALIAARRTRLEQLAEGGGLGARWAIKSVRQLSLMLAGAQLGITMASLGLGHVAEPAVARLIEGALHDLVELPAGVNHTISFVLALSIVVFLHMVVGEMAPKNVAIARPEQSAVMIALPFRLYVIALRPLIWMMNMLANAGLRLFKVEPREELVPAHSTRELGMMIREAGKEGGLRQWEQRLLTGAVGFSELDAAAVMIPRTEVVALPATSTPTEIEGVVLETGHSRLPVFGEDMDEVIGFVHAKDLLKVGAEARERALPATLIRRMPVVPESLELHTLLLEMRRARQHIALVVEEHGGTAGIVTLEDVLEELVGEIRDEFDASERRVERLPGDRYLVPGTLRIDELASQVGVELPDGDYETIAGFLMDRLGRIPQRRDVVEHDGWRLRVLRMQRRRVVQVLVERASEG